MWCDLSKEWQIAFEEAWISFKGGSIPIGAIITDEDGNVLMTGRNESGEGRYPNHRVAHAEASCVRNLDIEKYPNLSEYHLYTTMEPCPMCMGAIINARIKRLVYGASDPKNGACGSVADLSAMSFTHRIEVEKGFMAEECADELKAFFRKLRESKQ